MDEATIVRFSFNLISFKIIYFKALILGKKIPRNKNCVNKAAKHMISMVGYLIIWSS